MRIVVSAGSLRRGSFGARQSQAAWLPVIRALGMRPGFGQLPNLGGAAKAFGRAGRLVDEAIGGRLPGDVNGCVAFAAPARS